MIICDKNSCEKYSLKSDTIPRWWAEIVISSDGFFSAQSDYGDYAYIWNAYGIDFKGFLMDLNNCYLKGKLGRGLPKEFNFAGTIKNIKEYICEQRRKGFLAEVNDLNKEVARELWNECNKLHGCDNIDQFGDKIQSLSLYRILFDYDLSSIPIVMDDHYQLKAFLEIVWPEFIKIIKKEKEVNNGIRLHLAPKV